jgi:GNAT superfamily N-acetyltransferase
VTAPTDVSVKIVPPASAPARAALRDYFADIASRYHGRPVTESELDQVLADEPSDDLALSTGLFLVAFDDSGPIGCVGLRLLPAGLGEVTRVYVAGRARRQGLGGRLLEEVESAALANGCTTLRLDVRSDLVEARRLYAKHGYREVPAFNDSRYAEHWFAKDLDV